MLKTYHDRLSPLRVTKECDKVIKYLDKYSSENIYLIFDPLMMNRAVWNRYLRPHKTSYVSSGAGDARIPLSVFPA